MSAIVGIYYLNDQPTNPANLGQMVDILAHRGPDGAKIWSEGAIGLGHRMLWTTPESLLETLPLINQRGDCVITADARIDNREELIAALNLCDRAFEKITDSQLILAAYDKWGENCPKHLLGDFAFAIWDKRQQTLLCARDHFGVRPFYYHHCPGRIFVFASEIKALFCSSEVPQRLNELRIGDYLEVMLEDKVITFYEDIFRLPPGHSLTVNRKGLQLQHYWSLDPTRELRLSSDAEYAEAYREIFTEAVRCRLRSAFPVGSTLSGGLDSSSITCVGRELLAQQGGQPLKTFSAVFDKVSQCDERPYINAVLAQGRVEPYYIHADQLSPLSDIDRVLWHQDEPFYAPNLFMHWGLYQSAQQQGVRIFLDGLVGDSTVFHGWEYLIDLARTGRWLTLARVAEATAKRHGHPPWKLTRHHLWHHGVRPRVPQRLRQAWRLLRRRNPLAAFQLCPIVNPEFAKHIGLSDRIRAFQEDTSLWSARNYHHQYLSTGEIPLALEVANKAASAFAIETRFPFTDRRLVEFCLAIPPAQKLHNGYTRMIVRRALVNELPEKIRWRSDKANLAPNFRQGLLTFERDRLEQLILENPQAIEAYVDVDALRSVYQRYVSGGLKADVLPVWLAVTLALWLHHKNLNASTDETAKDVCVRAGDGEQDDGAHESVNLQLTSPH
jgi:asparagine synthase (glutamine-hydrolysing)